MNFKRPKLEMKGGKLYIPYAKVKFDESKLDALSSYVKLVRKKQAKNEFIDPIFEGVTKEEAQKTIDLEICPENYPDLDQTIVKVVHDHCYTFVKKFYNHFSFMIDDYHKSRLDACKTCDAQLTGLQKRSLQEEDSCEGYIFAYKGGYKPLSDIRYLGNKFLVLAMLDEEEPEIILTQEKNLRIYSSLFKAMFKCLVYSLNILRLGTPVQVSQLESLMNDICTCGRLYTLFNYNEKNKVTAIKEQEDILTGEDKGWDNYHPNKAYNLDLNVETKPDDPNINPLTGEKYKLYIYKDHCELKEELDGVIKDMHEWISLTDNLEIAIDPFTRKSLKKRLSQLRYVSHMAVAYRDTIRTRSSKFCDDDYYMSNKGTPSNNINFSHLSTAILKALYEPDPYKGCAMDELIGYVSYYISEEEAQKLNTEWVNCKTIYINNPSKVKGRIIHILLNAIQDRCNYIHNRLLPVLRLLIEDCTLNQRKGIDFLKEITDLDYRHEQNNSIYCCDFSNATDTHSPGFQEYILRIFLPEEVVQFWHSITSMEKYIKYPRQKLRKYKGTSSPQGALASFDGFALSHHFIMLVTMRITGRKDMNPKNFYRVLGDDSVINTYTEDDGLVLQVYYNVCEWANFIINRDKTQIVTPDQINAQADFAHVIVLNGKISTPTPTRLFFRSWHHGDSSTISMNLWRANNQSWVNREFLLNYVKKCYPENEQDYAVKIIFGGIIPLFDPLKIDSISNSVSNEEALLLSYYFLINQTRGSILLSLLTDKAKETIINQNEFKVKDGIDEFVKSSREAQIEFNQLMNKVDPQHKVWLSIERNADIQDALTMLLDPDNPLPRVIRASLQLTDTQKEIIQKISSLGEFIHDGVITHKDNIREIINWIFKDDRMKAWDKYTYRSDYKRAKTYTLFAKGAIKAYHQFLQEKSQKDL